jgi:hypothetical protein
MPKPPSGGTYLVDPQDAYPHEPEPVSNYNESMYFSLFDVPKKCGLWFRLGNRPNEGYAERTVCIYLPDGSVAFQAGRPSITDNRQMAAGGLHFDIIEPFEHKRAIFDGDVVLLRDPTVMANPSKAFKENPHVRARFELDFTAASPVIGGRPLNADGTEHVPEEASFGRAHFDQFMHGSGWIEIDGVTTELEGYGDRDHTWGPRYWQSIDAYRWVHVQFGPDLAFLFTINWRRLPERQVSGIVFRDGTFYDVADATIVSEWDSDHHHRSLHARVTTDDESFDLTGDVHSLIPLRNRREFDGEVKVTRITEAMTEYRYGDRVALGMSEYLDQIVDGRPIGPDISASV